MAEKRRRFAEGTSVDVAKTKAELDALLAKHGATQRAVFEDDDAGRAVVQFRMAERMVRLEVRLTLAKPLPDAAQSAWGQAKGVSVPTGWNSWSPPRRQEWLKAQREQYAREAWRRVLLVTKAKLEIVADGASTLEREFLSDVVLPDGRTVHEALRDGLARAYLDGTMPPLLPAHTESHEHG